MARREWERKQSQPRPIRVYTNEDLARPQILDPEDRARFEARRTTPTAAPAERGAQVLEAAKSPAELPLGDVARHYRWLKQLSEQQSSEETAVAPEVLPLGELPLGDVARYYRRLKELRETRLLEETAVLPNLQPLASPAPTKPPVSRHTPSDLRTLPSALVKEPAVSRPAEASKVVRVRRGDSLWKLARRHLGHGGRWREIASLNPQLADPNQIHPGQSLRLPDEGSSATAKKVRVQHGDSMWKLAQAEFGNGLAWGCIAHANPQVENADLIYAGQILHIPVRCHSIP